MHSCPLPFVLALSTSLALTASVASADCSPPSHASTCIDADVVWPAFGPTPFGTLPGASTTEAGRMAFGLVATYLRRPLVLELPTAAPTPVDAAAVSDLVDATALFSYGLTPRLDLGAAVPFTVYRNGSGVSVLTSQRAEDLPRAGLRDVRIGASYRLVDHLELGESTWANVAGRLELGLPTGDKDSFAGDKGVVGIPTLVAAVDSTSLYAEVVAGARIRSTTEVVGTRVGSQLAFGVGVGARFDPEDRYGIQAEAFALPTLTGQYVSTAGDAPGATPRTERSANSELVPCEWLLSGRVAPFTNARELSFSLGTGGPIRLSDSGATTASWRMLLGVRGPPAASGSESARSARTGL